jgi:hypothetical protein
VVTRLYRSDIGVHGRLWLINAGYHSVQFTIYGLVFGLM